MPTVPSKTRAKPCTCIFAALALVLCAALTLAGGTVFWRSNQVSDVFGCDPDQPKEQQLGCLIGPRDPGSAIQGARPLISGNMDYRYVASQAIFIMKVP